MYHTLLSLLKKHKLSLSPYSSVEIKMKNQQTKQSFASCASPFLLALYLVKERENKRKFSLHPSSQVVVLAPCFCKSMENAQYSSHLGELQCLFHPCCTATSALLILLPIFRHRNCIILNMPGILCFSPVSLFFHLLFFCLQCLDRSTHNGAVVSAFLFPFFDLQYINHTFLESGTGCPCITGEIKS